MTGDEDVCSVCGCKGPHGCIGHTTTDGWRDRLQRLVEEAQLPSVGIKKRIERITKLKQLMREFPNRSVEDLIKLLEVE